MGNDGRHSHSLFTKRVKANDKKTLWDHCNGRGEEKTTTETLSSD